MDIGIGQLPADGIPQLLGIVPHNRAPNDAVARIEVNYILPDMVAKAVNGMPTKRAMEWGQEQVALAVKGQLKTSG